MADPAAALAVTRQAQACFDAGRAAEAMALLREATALAPTTPAVWQNLAAALEQEGDYPAAAEAYRHAIALRPADPALRRAAGLLPSRAQRMGRLMAEGVARVRADDLDAGEARFAEALRMAPRSVVARGNLAGLLLRRGEARAAAEAYAAALADAGPSPDADRVRAESAMAWLLLGEYAHGFACFEQRWLLPGYAEFAAGFTAPRWTGAEELAGRRLLVVAEQGFGDSLHFVRYAALAAALGAEVELRVPAPLLRLLSGTPGVARVSPNHGPMPAADFVCPMLSLPHAFGTTLATIPADIPYLRPDPVLAAHWRARLARLPGRRIGLVWAGGAHADEPDAQAMDRRRSLTLAALAPLADLAGISFVSLQKERAEPPPPGLALHDWTAELADFADTAALVANLDLVISVDTAVAHLAGGMGRPVWLLNRFDTCWRWLLGRDDSPWYPTLRQFRQPSPGDWASVVAAVRAALARPHA